MQGIIFDFDDTLVETTVYFDQAKKKFAKRMQELGFPVPESLDTLNRFDIRNVLNCGGFLKECFPKALKETYEYYCDSHNQELCEQTSTWMEQIGWEVFEAPVVLIDGASEVVAKLAEQYRIFLATKGEADTQLERLNKTNLAQYFEKVYVVPDKTVVEYKRIAKENQLNPARSWVIGNSMKGDINPALRAGFNCIHVYHHHTWDFEEEEPIGEFKKVSSLLEIPENLL